MTHATIVRKFKNAIKAKVGKGERIAIDITARVHAPKGWVFGNDEPTMVKRFTEVWRTSTNGALYIGDGINAFSPDGFDDETLEAIMAGV